MIIIIIIINIIGKLFKTARSKYLTPSEFNLLVWRATSKAKLNLIAGLYFLC
jgi:hypothetical protein